MPSRSATKASTAGIIKPVHETLTTSETSAGPRPAAARARAASPVAASHATAR